MSSALTSAERTLFWAGLAVMIGLGLVEHARRDLTAAKRDLRSERNARVDLEDRVDQLAGQLDGALATIHRLMHDEPAGPAG